MVDNCKTVYKPVKYFYDSNRKMYIDPEANLVEEPNGRSQNNNALKLKVSKKIVLFVCAFLKNIFFNSS